MWEGRAHCWYVRMGCASPGGQMGVPRRAGAKLYVQRHELRPTPRSGLGGKMQRTWSGEQDVTGNEHRTKGANLPRCDASRVDGWALIPFAHSWQVRTDGNHCSVESCHGAWWVHGVRCSLHGKRRRRDRWRIGSAGHADAPISMPWCAAARARTCWPLRQSGPAGRRVAAQQYRAQASLLSSSRAPTRRGRRASVSSRHSAV